MNLLATSLATVAVILLISIEQLEAGIKKRDAADTEEQAAVFPPKLIEAVRVRRAHKRQKHDVTDGGQRSSMKFSIDHSWDGQPLDHRPVEIFLHAVTSDDQALLVDIYAPFFADPVPPGERQGGRIADLYNYEVAELFFLNSLTQKYLEVEVDPYGHWLVLLLDGVRHPIRDDLALNVTASFNRYSKSWHARVEIPLQYFPPGVDKFNAYAIHGTDPHRHYEALYPAPANEYDHPDFHRLELFQNISFASLVDPQFLCLSSNSTTAYWQ